MAIEKHSTTWRTVIAWAAKEEAKAIEKLISGPTRPDKVRGRIDALRELQKLGTKDERPIPVTDTYTT